MVSNKTFRIAICGLVRDCKQAAARSWEALQELKSDDTEIFWIFVENDSLDGSREWLEELALEHPNVTVLGENLGELTIPPIASGQVMPGFSIRRISKMAYFRNLYLDHVKSRIGLENLDALVVIDFDVLSLPVRHLKRCIEHVKPGEAVTALGSWYHPKLGSCFYDCYAYRECGNNRPQTYCEIDSQRRGLWRAFRSTRKPIQVDSNFNGCAVYPASAFENSQYVVLPNDDPRIECYVEHVGLHSQMRADGVRVWLDPKLRVFYETPFSYWFGKFRRGFARLLPSGFR